MALPKINHPTFEVTLPSSKDKIVVRPFLVKEEKILLMAMQGEDSDEIINSIKQVINNCIITEGVDIDKLATFDLEYLFLKIRARSVNNVIKLTYKDLEDELKYDVEVNLDEVEVKFDPAHTNKIEVTDKLGFYLAYPHAGMSEKISNTDSEADLFFDILKNCIDKIYDGDNVYMASDSSSEELEEFLQNLDVKSFKKIQDFFQTMPRLYHEIKYTNSLGNERTIKLSSLNDFFMLG